MLKIGTRLRTLRHLNNYSEQDVINKLKSQFNLDFCTTSLYKWEENRAEPDIFTLVALSHIYHTSISFILDDTILDMQDLTKQEIFLLDIYRHNEIFMRIALLLSRYLAS